MIKEKAYEILDLIAYQKTIEADLTKLVEEHRALIDRIQLSKVEINKKKQELGNIINPPIKGSEAFVRQNSWAANETVRAKRTISDIILERDGKTYCLYFDSKYSTAGIKEVISCDEAEKQLMIKKMEQK